MINPRRLSSLGRKWRKFPSRNKEKNSSKTSEKGMHFTVATKGHFVVYTSDKGRYEIPLEYLKSNIFEELLRVSEEEFGLPKNGPITLHCDSQFLDYVVSLVRGDKWEEELEKALLTSTATCHGSCRVFRCSQYNSVGFESGVAGICYCN